MKHSKLQKLVTLFLVLGLMVSISACGNSTNNSVQSSANTSTTTAVTTTAATTEQAADPFGKYDPTIELTSVHSTNTSITWPNGDDASNNPYTREVEKTLGIKVKYDWSVDIAQYDTKLNVSIASGALPDFFLVRDSKTFVNLATSGQVFDLTDTYEKFASPRIKECSSSFPEGFDSAKVDGKLMGLPQLGFGTMTIPDILWIRNDWLKKFNLSAPQSMDDLLKIAQTFMKNIPGSYGIALNKGYGGGVSDMAPIANAYHAYPYIWIKDATGQIAYGSIQPEMKTVLKALQDMYKTGILNKEFAVEDINKTNEDIINGKVGIEFGANWDGYWPFTDAVKKDKDADWRAFAIPSADGGPVKVQCTWPISGYCVVNKSCKNPEAVIKIANLFMKINDEDTFHDATARNNWPDCPVTYNDPASSYNLFVHASDAISAKDPSKLTANEKGYYDSVMKWIDQKDPSGLGAYLQFTSEMGSFSVLKKYVDDNNIMLTELRGADPDIYAQKKATLDKIELDTFTKIIMGASIDEFDKFVTNWNNLGGSETTKAINDIYSK